MQWSGEASRLLKTINELADRDGKVSIGLLNDFVGSSQDRLLAMLHAMAEANIINLDEGSRTVSLMSVRRR
jgi:hypothetical protein